MLATGFWLRPATPWGVLGCVCARAPVPRGLPHLLVGGAVRGCVFVRAPRLFPAFPGWGVLCGREGLARVSAVPPPSWLGCRGVFSFGRILLWLFGVGCWLFLSWALWSLSPHPLSFGLGCWLFFCFQRGVCLRVLVSLFPVGRCSWFGVAGFGWVVPLSPFLGVLSSVPSGSGVWTPSVVLAGGLLAVGRSPAPPPPSLFFLWGGGLSVPPSASPGLAHALARIQCGLQGCCW